MGHGVGVQVVGHVPRLALHVDKDTILHSYMPRSEGRLMGRYTEY